MPNELTSNSAQTASVTPTAPVAAPQTAAPAQQNTQTPAQSQQSESSEQQSSIGNNMPADKSADVQKGNDFADALRAEMQSYMDAEVKTDEAAKENPQQTEQQSEQQTEQQEEPQKEQEQQEQQEETYRPYVRESDGREVIPAIYIDEFQREVTLEELVDKFKGFDYYHQNAMKQKQDAQRINEVAAQLSRQKAELQQKLDEFNASKNDPLYKIVQLFKGDNELKNRVTQLVRQLRPNGMKNLEANAQFEEQKAQMVEMQKTIDALKNIEIQRTQLANKQAMDQQARVTKYQLANFIEGRRKELAQHGIQITAEDLNGIARQCQTMFRPEQQTFQNLAGVFDNYFRMIANKGQQLINSYQQQKRSAPPAPPSGGAAPAITPTPIRGAEDFESTLAARLSQLLGNI